MDNNFIPLGQVWRSRLHRFSRTLDASGCLRLCFILRTDCGAPFFQARLLVQNRLELLAVRRRVIGGLLQQALKLRLQFSQPALDPADAQAASIGWLQLHFHCVGDLLNQALFIRHDRIDSGQYCLLEWPLLHRRRVMAVFLAVLQPAHTTPDDLLPILAHPSTASIQGAALSANQPLGKCIFACVTGTPRHRQFRRAFRRLAPCQLRLHLIELLAADNTLMIIFYQVHRPLTGIFDDLTIDKILPESLLHQDISAVFLIFQNPADLNGCPAALALDALLNQLIFDHAQTRTAEVSIIDPPHNLSLLRNDLRLVVWPASIGVEVFVLDDRSPILHGSAFTPTDVCRNGLTLRLGKSTCESNTELAVLLQRIDVLLLENDTDTERFQCTGVVKAVHCISRKSRDRLGQDDIDFVLAAVADHPHEFIPLLRRGTRDTLVSVYPSHRPSGVGHDFFGVVFLLHFVTVDLILLLCGHPTVGGYPKLLPTLILYSIWSGWDLNYLRFFILHLSLHLLSSAHSLTSALPIGE